MVRTAFSLSLSFFSFTIYESFSALALTRKEKEKIYKNALFFFFLLERKKRNLKSKDTSTIFNFISATQPPTIVCTGALYFQLIDSFFYANVKYG